MPAIGVRSSCETVAMNSVFASSSPRSLVRSRNAYTMPSALRTATNESQSSAPPTSSGSVTGATGAPPSETGIWAAIVSQPCRTSVTGWSRAASVERPVSRTAAPFQSLTRPSASTRKIPSPTASSTFAARSRSAATASARTRAAASACPALCRRALRTAAPINATSASPSASWSCVYGSPSLISWTTPTTRPSCLTGSIIAARVPGGPVSGTLRTVPSRSTS